ncbi:MAG: T9SS type A sorting domain-containing protein, partial [Bacteroidota bacterium]
DFVEIELSVPGTGKYQLSLLDPAGRELRYIEESSRSNPFATYTISTASLSAGIYFIKLQTENRVLYQKVLKQ